MKRAFAFLLAVAMTAAFCGCGSKNDTSSISKAVDKMLEESGNDLGLVTSYSTSSNSASTDTSSAAVSSAEASSAASSVASKADTVSSSEPQSTVTTPKKDVSTTSSKSTSSKKKNSNLVPISKLYNPTGIQSTGRKNNSGSNWKMTLVNPWNTLNKNYSIDVTLMDSRYGDGKYFDSRAVKYLNNMCKAASKDGANLYAISTYRTYDYQKMLYDNQVASVKAANPNMSDKEAKAEAATVVARPGTSEHNIGLAVDFNSVEESFKNTKEFRWLQKHCTEYGFIMRYAKSKQSYTGVIYEPWHYRFVGVENAKKIAASGLSMEEYIAQNG